MTECRRLKGSKCTKLDGFLDFDSSGPITVKIGRAVPMVVRPLAQRTVLKYRSRTFTSMQITVQYGSRLFTFRTESPLGTVNVHQLFTPFEQESDVFFRSAKSILNGEETIFNSLENQINPSNQQCHQFHTFQLHQKTQSGQKIIRA